MTLQHTMTTAPGATRCPRCGRALTDRGNVIAVHLKACRRVPRPDELAEVFRLEATVNVPDLGRRYGVHADFIRAHLLSAGITAAAIRGRGSAAQGGSAKYRQRAQGTLLCSVCELDLKHPVVPAGDGEKCGWCASGR